MIMNYNYKNRFFFLGCFFIVVEVLIVSDFAVVHMYSIDKYDSAAHLCNDTPSYIFSQGGLIV